MDLNLYIRCGASRRSRSARCGVVVFALTLVLGVAVIAWIVKTIRAQ